jgi:hypothetical protein
MSGVPDESIRSLFHQTREICQSYAHSSVRTYEGFLGSGAETPSLFPSLRVLAIFYCTVREAVAQETRSLVPCQQSTDVSSNHKILPLWLSERSPAAQGRKSFRRIFYLSVGSFAHNRPSYAILVI